MRLLAATWLALLAGCGISDGGPDPAVPVLEGLGTQVVLPRYEQFATDMSVAASAAEAFCGSPDAARLDVARQTLATAFVAWKRSEVIAFGPARDVPWAVRARIDLWPVREEPVRELLDGEEPITAESLRTTPNAAKGLPVLAWLLGAEEDTLAAFTSTDDGLRRCEVLTALATDSASAADLMVNAWTPEGDAWLTEFTAPPGPRAAFNNTYEVVAELVNRMIFTVENVRLIKLSSPAGLNSGGAPDPSLLEARYSGQSLDAIRSNLDGVEDLLWGRYQGASVPGVITLAPEDRAATIGEAFDLAMAESHLALDAIPLPLDESFLVETAPVQTAVSALLDLQRVLQADLTQALGVTVRFNDTDGD